MPCCLRTELCCPPATAKQRGSAGSGAKPPQHPAECKHTAAASGAGCAGAGSSSSTAVPHQAPELQLPTALQTPTLALPLRGAAHLLSAAECTPPGPEEEGAALAGLARSGCRPFCSTRRLGEAGVEVASLDGVTFTSASLTYITGRPALRLPSLGTEACASRPRLHPATACARQSQVDTWQLGHGESSTQGPQGTTAV